MGVDQIVVLLPDLLDDLAGLFFVAEAAVEVVLQLGLQILGDLIAAGGVQLLHVAGHSCIVLLGEGKQQTLQVAGHQDVHRGGHGGVEGAVLVVHAGGQELGENVVAVGGADELTHGQTHLTGVPAGQDVAEVAGGDTVVHLVAHLDLALVQQVAVGGDVVDQLRQDAAPVDGVGGGQEVATLCQVGTELLVGEEDLHAGLGIVEVAVDRADTHVIALLGLHLELLDLGDAAGGIEDQDLGALHVLEALQSGLAGVAGGGHQDADGLVLVGLHQGGGEQVGQDLQGHILKGGGGAVPQLQAVGLVVQLVHGGHTAVVKLLVGVAGLGEGGQFLLGEILQEELHQGHGTLAVGLASPVLQHFRGELGEDLRGEQAAVTGQALGNGLAGSQAHGLVSGADISHG